MYYKTVTHLTKIKDNNMLELPFPPAGMPPVAVTFRVIASPVMLFPWCLMPCVSFYIAKLLNFIFTTYIFIAFM